MNVTKSKVEISQPSKQRKYPFWLTCLTFLLGLPLLFYYGYCWGLWGRSSLLLQYLFQCNCPVASEERRYPKYVDVVVSACKYRGTLLSPSGHLLYAKEEEAGILTSYLLNFETNEKTSFTLKEGGFFFLTDNLLFVTVRYRENEYILDRTTGEIYPIQGFAYSHPGSYIDGNANPIKLVTALRKAKHVFLLRDYGDTLVVLSPDFPASPELNFYVNRFDIVGDASDRLDQFLKENNIAYTDIPFRYQNQVISPNGKLIAQTDGIYSVESSQLIVKGISSWGNTWQVMGWVYDGSAAIYSHHYKPCVFRAPGYDGTICVGKVHQPVLLLKVPEKYLLPTP